MTSGLDLLRQAVTSHNLILVQGLGLYAFTRYTQSVEEAVKSGGTTLAAMLLGSLLLWAGDGFVFTSLSAELGFYLLVGTCSSLIAHRLFSSERAWEKGLFDSALVGVLLLMGRDGIFGVNAFWTALAAGLGYFLTLMVAATLRERLQLAPIPKALQGIPIVLITAGLLAVAFLGFRF